MLSRKKDNFWTDLLAILPAHVLLLKLLAKHNLIFENKLVCVYRSKSPQKLRTGTWPRVLGMIYHSRIQ